MFSFSLSFCKQVARRRSFRLICRDFSFPFAKDSPLNYDVSSPVDNTRPGLSFTTKYINEAEKPEDIQWDDLTKKLQNLNVENPSTKILQACLRLEKIDLGLRYYEYLTANRIQLSSVDIMFFSKLLLKKKSEIEKYEQVVLRLYKDIKEHMQSSSLVRGFLLEVFVEIPACFEDIIKTGRSNICSGGYLPVVEKALEMNMPDVAFEFMSDFDFYTTRNFMESYINFCIRAAKEGKFSKDHINKLIKVCESKLINFSHETLLVPLRSLVSALNKHDNTYEWSISECRLSATQNCSCCGLSLLSTTISNKEFRRLSQHFLEHSFISSNVFLSSTRLELNRFLEFLRTTNYYNLVIDGLNLMYKNKQCGTRSNNRTLKYFLDKGFSLLTIGKIHSKQTLTKGEFLKHYEDKCQFFFTSNMSDDDLFVLYAALFGGPGTYFVSGDQLKTYSGRLDHDMKTLFSKWQLSHQYVVKPNFSLMPPLPHCGLSQLTFQTEDECIWHLSQQNTSRMRVNASSPIDWFCLRAKRRKPTKLSNCMG